jgi:hypothetical protein
MREETITIYNYSELSDKAKDNAYENFVMNNEHHFAEEGMDTLISFLKWSGISIGRYEIGAYQYSYIKTDIPEDCQEEIRTMEVECRLLGLDEQDTEDRLLQSFEQIQIDINHLSPHHPDESLKHWGSEWCMTDDIIHYWDTHLKENPLDNIGALHAVVDGALSQMVADLEHQDSREYFEEVMQDYHQNEYEEDGTLH